MSDQEDQQRLLPKKRPVKLEMVDNTQDKEEDEEDDQDFDEEDFDSEEDEEDSDDEEDDQEQSGRSRRPKKRPRNALIDFEADVDEDDEDEDFDDEEEDDFIDEVNEAEKLRPQVYREIDQRRDKERLEDAEDLTRRLRERYGRGSYAEPSAYIGDAGSVPMQFLLPSPKDPNLWLVRCKPGKERDIALNLMRKFMDYLSTDHPLRIKSIVTRDTLKGYIYVEARSMSDVQNAVDKLNNVYASKITLVPLEEMVDVMTIKRKQNELKVGAWVRIARGRYKGDLAQVLSAENSDRVEVRFIPRLDYNAKISGEKRKIAIRPEQKLFNQKDVPKNDRSLTLSGAFWAWGNDRFDKEGFMVKEMNFKSLVTENVTPSLEEIKRFSSTQDVDEPLNLSNLNNEKHTGEQFALGDAVVVTDGDLVNASGTVKSIRKDHVVIHMRDEDMGEVEIEKSKLSRLFQVGDHVKVIKGKFKDETGMITQVRGNIVTIFSDATMAQFQVFAKDVRTAAEVLINEDEKGGFLVNDLVQLVSNEIGVVVKVEKDQYRVMDQTGNVKPIKLAEITQKKDNRRAVALDANQFTVRAGDVVEVLYGEQAHRQATILHLYRTWAFLYSKDIVDNGGIFVVRTRSIKIAGNAGINAQNIPGFKAPAPQLSSRRRELIHQTVYITKGSFKGYQGFVKDVTEKGARVQLNTNAKIIIVNPSDLRLKDGSTPSAASETFATNRFAGGTTPAWGSRTPATFGGTQAEGAKTPAWDAGAKTPAWDAGSRTPAHLAFGLSPDIEEPTPVGTYSGWNTSASPFTATPGSNAGTPFTPGTPAAHTPASGWGEAERVAVEKKEREYGSEWLTLNIEVKFLKGQYADQIGYVAEVMDGGKTGAVVLEKAKIAISCEHLEPVLPSKKDACIFLAGEFKNMAGQLIGMDGDDAIVKLDDGGDFKIGSMNHVCKLHVKSPE